MRFIEFRITSQPELNELLIFELDGIKDISFWEHEDGLSVYIPNAEINIEELKTYLTAFKKRGFEFNFEYNILPQINWNKEWESNYEPLVIAGKYFIRAPFHPKSKADLKTFTIVPKMAFGTGHHATTELIFTLLDLLSFNDKKVLDYGTGTGILAILAEFKGASEIQAIDIEDEAVESTIENSKLNNCHKIIVHKGGLEQVQTHQFDIIIANINRNILVNSANEINNLLVPGGKLLLSGFYSEDEEIIKEAFGKYSIITHKKLIKNNWLALYCIKNN
ncbi:50S ribosomal protein L11 methyltransferase [Bacteroidota bacterium]